MRKLYILLVAIAATLCCKAQVECQPGMLSQLVTDHNITSLTVSGAMDARDFKFVAQKLDKLVSVDLSNVEIKAYDNLSSPVLGTEYDNPAGTVPTMAFAGKQALTTVLLPKGGTGVGTAAFAACPKLTTVVAGDALTSIGDYAFSGCNALVSITLPASLSYVGQGAFSRCPALTTFTVSNVGTPASSLDIADEAFLDCRALSKFTASNVTTIGNSAFAGTAMTDVNLMHCSKLHSIGDYAFALSGTSRAIMPTSLKKLGKGIFIYSDALDQVTLPKDVETVGDYAFAGNSKLVAVDLGGAKEIGAYAFYDARSLQDITIPQRTTYIGTRAMAGTTSLMRVMSPSKEMAMLGDDVWEGVNQHDVLLYVPISAIDDYKSAQQWREFSVLGCVLLGDVNADDVIDISDVNELLNIILTSDEGYPFQADANQDGIVDIADVNTIINFILSVKEPQYIFVTPNE